MKLRSAMAFVGLAVLMGLASAVQVLAGAASGVELPASGKEFKDCADCPTMVSVPPGSFMMGSPQSGIYGQSDEYPQHKVTIANKFALGRTEVSREEYARFVADTKRASEVGCRTTDGRVDEKTGQPTFEQLADKDWRDPGFPQTEKDPVLCISYQDAADYAAWLSAKTGKKYRIPSEAEFEYAARGGASTVFPWGDNPDEACLYGNVGDLSAHEKFPGYISVPQCKDGYIYTAPVGSFRPNKFGLYDMSANVFEWTADCGSENYEGAPADGSVWQHPDCQFHVFRGGIWNCTLTCNVATIPPNQINNVQPGAVFRPANRTVVRTVNYKADTIGFRVARGE